MSVPVISLHAIEKVYPGVKPLDRVDFTVRPGEIHALLGENGAGKSTLTRIIGGAVKPNAGTIEYLGKPVSWRSPREAQEAGIHIIHQELALFPELTVAENILIGAQPRGLFGLLSRAAAIRKAEAILARLGVDIPARAHIDELSLADQQMVEIAKALTGDVKLIVFDEPTAVISGREVDLLFDNMRRLRAEGLGIVYISHRLEEIFEIADRVTVLKDGQVAGVSAVKDLTRDTMITMMVGRQLEQIFPPKPAVATDKPVVLSIEKLAAGNRLHDASLEVRAGEIVALAGMVGSGRTEVAEAVFGYRDVDAGTIKVDGKALAAHTPKEAIGRGVGFLTENRKEEGLFLGLSIAANILAPSLRTVSSGGMIERRRERAIAEKQIQAFGVATPSQDVKVGNLSGGNQQKVLFSRWSRIADRLLILDEPTRGVDVGAKVEIYRMIRHLADQGIAVLMISSELPEVVGLADRVVVMAQGRVAGELEGDAIGEESIMKLAVVSIGSGASAGEGKLQMTAIAGVFQRHRMLPSYLIVLILLAILVVTGGALSDRFLTWRNFGNLFQQMVVLGVASLGQTFVILIGGIDLAIGALVGAVTVFLANFLQWQPDWIIPAIAIALVGSTAIGALNGILTVTLRVHPLIVTLGTSSVIFGATLMYRKEPGGSVPPVFEELAYGDIAGIPYTALALVVIFALAGLWLQRTRSGRSLYFVGGNHEAARLNGVAVSRVTILVYALSGLCAGIAAIFLVARTGVGDPRIGQTLTLQSITPVVVGGTILIGGRGGVLGTFLGVLLVSMLNSMLNFSGVSSFYQWVVQGVIIIAAVGLHKTRRE